MLTRPCACSDFDTHSGMFTFLSYRDPNLLKTCDVYDGTADFLRKLELDDDALTKVLTWPGGAPPWGVERCWAAGSSPRWEQPQHCELDGAAAALPIGWRPRKLPWSVAQVAAVGTLEWRQ